MNWLTRTISKVFPRKKKSLDIAENAWIKCSQCQTMLYSSDLEKTLFVCPNCVNTYKFILVSDLKIYLMAVYLRK